AANYSFGYANGTLQVGVPLTITVNNASRAYGAANPSFGVTALGFTGGDTIANLGGTPVFTTAATAASGVGTYNVSVPGHPPAKYALTYQHGTLSVTPVALTVTANNASRAYGSSNPTLSAIAAGLVNGDTLTSLGGVACTCVADSSSTVNGG